MRYNQRNFVCGIIIVTLVLCSCAQDQIEKQSRQTSEDSNDSLTHKINIVDGLNSLQFTNVSGDNFKVDYINDTIQINRGLKNSLLKIPHKSPAFESILPCNCLAIFDKKETIRFENHYFYNDTLLLLPVKSINNITYLLTINLNSGKTLNLNGRNETKLLGTYLTVFVINASDKTIITSNSLDLNEKALIHYFTISGAQIKEIKSVEKTYNRDVNYNEEKMKVLIHSLVR
jgi:hypothetical protein